MRLGVLVPCRNEHAVLGRKLRNLARVSWPATTGRHRLVVVDDDSVDGTSALALRLTRELFGGGPIEATVVANQRRSGKCGAIAQGLAELGEAVDLVVLTDADVVLREGALLALVEAFEREQALGLACGAQELVRDLAPDGSLRGANRAAVVRVDGLYDRATSLVRRLESSWGKLFSVHGQLMAWRRADGLAPAPGVAADDLDLMLAVRARGGRVRRVRAARFLEQKTGRPEQALRRARAYFQVLRGRRRPLGRGLLDRLQWGFYRFVPGAAPELCVAALAVLVVLAFRGGELGLAAALVLAAAAVHPAGRRLARLLSVIHTARRTEARVPPSDSWEMQRS